MKKSKSTKTITIKRKHKCRAPHKPTRVHRDKTKYTRKGKTGDKRKKELHEDLEDTE